MLQLKSIPLFMPADVHQSKHHAFVASFVLSLIFIFLMCVLLAPNLLVYEPAPEKGILPKYHSWMQLCPICHKISNTYRVLKV